MDISPEPCLDIVKRCIWCILHNTWGSSRKYTTNMHYEVWLYVLQCFRNVNLSRVLHCFQAEVTVKCHGNTWKAWNKQICGGKLSRKWECIHHCVLRLTALTKRPTTATATTRSQPLSRHVTFCDIHYTEYFSYCMGFRVGQTLCSMRISTVVKSNCGPSCW